MSGFRSSEIYKKHKERKILEQKYNKINLSDEEKEKRIKLAENIDPDEKFTKHFLNEDVITSFDYGGKTIVEYCEECGYFDRHPEMVKYKK